MDFLDSREFRRHAVSLFPQHFDNGRHPIDRRGVDTKFVIIWWNRHRWKRFGLGVEGGLAAFQSVKVGQQRRWHDGQGLRVRIYYYRF